jgi:hypothetical protein
MRLAVSYTVQYLAMLQEKAQAMRAEATPTPPSYESGDWWSPL